MATTLTKQEVQKILSNAPAGADPRKLLDGLVKRGFEIEGVDPVYQASIRGESRVEAENVGNQFSEANTSNKGKNILQKTRNFVVDLVGGKKLAQGAGLAMAAPEVFEKQEQATERLTGTQTALMKRIREKEAKGEDAARLRSALVDSQATGKIGIDVVNDLLEELPTNTEVLGSATRLAGTLAGGEIAGGFNKLIPAAKPTILGGVLRGAGVGASAGAVEGAIQGGGVAAEEGGGTKEIVEGAGVGALGGAVLGGGVGAIAGGVSGRSAKLASDETLIDNITPRANELSQKEYGKFVAQGRIDPKTPLNQAKVNLPDSLRETALKYRDVVDKDPVKTATNITGKIRELDDEVGRFLRQNNGIFSKGELRNYLNTSLDGLEDVTVDEARLAKVKELLVKNFTEGIETNDLESLWIARKNFDTAVKGAFSGSPTLKKQAEVAVRDAVQDFISERTPNAEYAGFMKDMSRLFRVRDYVVLKAGKERALNALQKIGKDNPALGWLAGTALGIFVFNQLQNTVGRIGGDRE